MMEAATTRAALGLPNTLKQRRMPCPSSIDTCNRAIQHHSGGWTKIIESERQCQVSWTTHLLRIPVIPVRWRTKGISGIRYIIALWRDCLMASNMSNQRCHPRSNINRHLISPFIGLEVDPILGDRLMLSTRKVIQARRVHQEMDTETKLLYIGGRHTWIKCLQLNLLVVQKEILGIKSRI